MPKTQDNGCARAQIRLAGAPVMAFSLLVVIFLGHQAAHAQSPIGTAESCFDAGPDRVPAFTVTPVPPVRAGLRAQAQPRSQGVASLDAKLIPAGYTPLRALPVHLLNTGNKDRWAPNARKSPELIASAR